MQPRFAARSITERRAENFISYTEIGRIHEQYMIQRDKLGATDRREDNRETGQDKYTVLVP